MGPSTETRIAAGTASLGCTWPNTEAVDAFCLGQIALAAHDKALGPNHAWTKDSARVTADALDAAGRTAEAAMLRERYRIEGVNG